MNAFALPDSVPQRGNWFTKSLGRLSLYVLRWKIKGSFPNYPQMVLIVAPHTSNWDFVIGVSAMLALGLKARWLGKHTIFRPPFASLLQWLGGIPVNRTLSQGVVEQTAALFRQHPKLILGLSPEGTRKRVDRWKSGFYNIALLASVPILAVAFDFATKTILIGPAVLPSGQWESDMAPIRAFYQTTTGKHPENFHLGV